MRGLLLIALVSLGATSAAAQVAALKPAAKAKLDRGMKLASEKNYEGAIKELRAGYVMSEAREFLYAMGQVERLRGNCRAALTLYQTFLDTGPRAEQVSATKVQMERCEAELKPAEVKVEPTPAPVEPPVATGPPDVAATPALKPAEVAVAPVAPTVAPPLTVTSAPPRPWYTDALGNVLLISGGVLAIAGGTLFGVGNVSAQNATRTLDGYAAAKDLTWAQPVGLSLMGAGGAAVAASIIRYATMNGSAPAATVGVSASGNGGVIVVSGRF